jgi:hypothetical protein
LLHIGREAEESGNNRRAIARKLAGHEMGTVRIGGGGDVVNVGLIVILLFLFELRTA